VTLHVLQTNSQQLAGGDDNTPDTVTKTYALKLYHDAYTLV